MTRFSPKKSALIALAGVLVPALLSSLNTCVTARAQVEAARSQVTAARIEAAAKLEAARLEAGGRPQPGLNPTIVQPGSAAEAVE